MKSRGQIHIGTSGRHHDHWKDLFYPQGLSKRRFLEYYTKNYGTAEINNSFCQLPSTQTPIKWRGMVPEGFVFAVKANRYITHMKKLKEMVSSHADTQ